MSKSSILLCACKNAGKKEEEFLFGETHTPLAVSRFAIACHFHSFFSRFFFWRVNIRILAPCNTELRLTASFSCFVMKSAVGLWSPNKKNVHIYDLNVIQYPRDGINLYCIIVCHSFIAFPLIELDIAHLSERALEKKSTRPIQITFFFHWWQQRRWRRRQQACRQAGEQNVDKWVYLAFPHFGAVSLLTIRKVHSHTLNYFFFIFCFVFNFVLSLWNCYWLFSQPITTKINESIKTRVNSKWWIDSCASKQCIFFNQNPKYVENKIKYSIAFRLFFLLKLFCFWRNSIN